MMHFDIHELLTLEQILHNDTISNAMLSEATLLKHLQFKKSQKRKGYNKFCNAFCVFMFLLFHIQNNWYLNLWYDRLMIWILRFLTKNIIHKKSSKAYQAVKKHLILHILESHKQLNWFQNNKIFENIKYRSFYTCINRIFIKRTSANINPRNLDPFWFLEHMCLKTVMQIK